MPEIVAKTGDFYLQIEAGPDTAEDERHYQWARVLDTMNLILKEITRDGRSYEMQVELGTWEPADHRMQRRRVKFILILLDPLQTEVGEWVKNLPHLVSDNIQEVRLGKGHGAASGWIFERGRCGWKRIG